MDVPIWIWKFDLDYGREALAGSDDAALPMSEAWVKANDGLTLQGVFDTHPAGVDEVADALVLDRDVYAPQGVELIPWGVVHGRLEGQQQYAQREGTLAGAIAVAAAPGGERRTYIVDLEPHGRHYWRHDLGATSADVLAYTEAFKRAGGAELWLTVDARRGPTFDHLASVLFPVWMAQDAVTRVVPMLYFTDFRRRPDGSVPAVSEADIRGDFDRMFGALRAHVATLAQGRVYPALPANASPSELVFAIHEAKRRGCGGVSIYRRGMLSPAAAKAIADMPDLWASQPELPGTPPPSSLAELRGISADLGRVLTDTAAAKARVDRLIAGAS